MWLEPSIFCTVVEHTPLVSLDLLVRNDTGEVLLGKRVNRPAQDYWFVPGGRIAKDERIEDSFARLAREELGVSCLIEDALFLGNYQHFYQDNFSGAAFSTHYVVLAYELRLNLSIGLLPGEQHNEYHWFQETELLEMDSVHQHTKDYFV